MLDSDPLSPASVYRMAELAGTIPYEIFCRIGTRVRRVAVNEFGLRGRRRKRSSNWKRNNRDSFFDYFRLPMNRSRSRNMLMKSR